MARTVAELPKGSRITDYISLGVLNQRIPREAVDEAVVASGRASLRHRDLPAHVVVYYVIALALYMQSSYREVLRCLLEGACTGWATPRLGRGWRGSRGFRKPGRGSAPNRCGRCTMRWSSRWVSHRRRGAATGSGRW